MLKLSKKVDYGLILLSRLREQPMSASAREMAERYKLPSHMVANILKQLTAAGILVSTRGAQGGYELARDASRISLADIVNALEGPISLVDCAGEDPTCRYTEQCPTHEPIQNVHRRFQEFMTAYTLDEVIGTRGQGPFQFQLG
ncbi:MAG TPA: Rrf2 family transcriptional regulator [bacterium]|nr:Rrf2 family transcriptional regulator [bacterium]